MLADVDRAAGRPPGRPDEPGVYCPTRETIARACAAIRQVHATWGPDDADP